MYALPTDGRSLALRVACALIEVDVAFLADNIREAPADTLGTQCTPTATQATLHNHRMEREVDCVKEVGYNICGKI